MEYGGEEEAANSGEQSGEADTGNTSVYIGGIVIWGN